MYDSVGWSQNLTSLVGNWYFLDENITTDAFRTLNNAKQQENLEWKSVIHSIKYLLFNDKMVCMQVACWFLLLIVITYVYYKKKKWKNLFEVWGYFIVFCFVAIYFACKGRLPLRVYEAIIYTFLIPCIFSIVMTVDFCRDGKGLYGAAIIGVCSIIMIQTPIGMWSRTYSLANDETRKSRVYTKTMVESYAIGHSDNIYIYDVSMTMSGDPFTVYPNVKPNNLLFWGGSGCYSPLYYEQLESNGLDTLYPEDFFADNIFFIGESEISPILYNYMMELYPDSSCSIVEKTKDFVIYRFVR